MRSDICSGMSAHIRYVSNLIGLVDKAQSTCNYEKLLKATIMLLKYLKKASATYHNPDIYVLTLRKHGFALHKLGRSGAAIDCVQYAVHVARVNDLPRQLLASLQDLVYLYEATGAPLTADQISQYLHCNDPDTATTRLPSIPELQAI